MEKIVLYQIIESIRVCGFFGPNVKLLNLIFNMKFNESVVMIKRDCTFFYPSKDALFSTD